MSHNTLFAPLITLVLWTFVMWAWLYATRIPAIRKNRIPLDPTQSKEAFNAQIPPQARWKADNYNHLLEQPTLFYAVTLSLVVLGASGAINGACLELCGAAHRPQSRAGDDECDPDPFLNIHRLVACAACAHAARGDARLLMLRLRPPDDAHSAKPA
jgi:hypothetical protein